MESLLFDDHEVIFSHPEAATMYREERNRLFAYVMQNIEDCDMPLREYVLKDNPNVSWSEAQQALEKLHSFLKMMK